MRTSKWCLLYGLNKGLSFGIVLTPLHFIIRPMENETSLIRVDCVSRYFGDFCAVDNISFDVKKGEVLGLLGPNGAGKSTTMQMLTGNLAPSAGQVWINGVDLLDQPKLAKAQLGYLPDTPPLYRELNVNEYLIYCAKLNRVPSVQRQAALDKAKQRCGLTEVGKRLIGNLSKGYRQRVGIAQAIIHSPAVVILDEPTVGLDPIQIREIRHLIRELSHEHSVILSTHILPEVQAVCDRVQIINQGKLILSDSIDGLQQRMTTSSWVLGLRKAPAESVLAEQAGLERIEVLDGNRFRVFGSDEQLVERLAVTAVEQGWGLFELSPERMSLEQVFVSLTTQDEVHQGEAS